jgi:hypothetical protein
MNIERLKHLIEVLKKVPEEKFNLEFWRNYDEADPFDESFDTITKKALRKYGLGTIRELSDSDFDVVMDCGTVACAVGWATSDREFNAQGFYYGLYPYYTDETDKTYYNWNAVEKFFEIEPITAQQLFSEESYIFFAKPIHVIERMEALLTLSKEDFKQLIQTQNEANYNG